MQTSTHSLSQAKPEQGRGSFFVLQLFRTAIGIAVASFVCFTIDLGTHPAWLIGAVVVGTLLAGGLLSRHYTLLRAVIVHIVVYLALAGILWLANLFSVGGAEADPSRDFFVSRLANHIWLIAAFYCFSFLGTWVFWTRRFFVTFEALLFSCFFVWLLSSHRNYHLDAPKEISSLAWSWGTVLLGREFAPQHLLLGFGIVFTLFLGLYLTLASGRQLVNQTPVIRSRGRVRSLVLFLTPLAVFLFLLAFASYVNSKFSADMSRAMNGVGNKAPEEGESPLGFHSAIGKTRQPAALVRLEGDYTENPWSPMLYLREGALSDYNGKELVTAHAGLDMDVPRLNPGQPYIALEKQQDPLRKELRQSVYLLTQHKASFAIDYPYSIRLLKNPDEDKFILAYQALSLAPMTKLDLLIGEDTGNPEWDDATRAHYLRAPGSFHQESGDESDLENAEKPVLDKYGEDLRYKALAKSLSLGIDSPVMKAAQIAQFLSQESTYTRAPGHTPTTQGDPVAPYLFSEKKRGYCVHFSHAAVYLMRLVGIPARIATGYLTDLTYAKDGHILLHLGDRHAWPEIYVKGQGWVVADIVPANAENEQEIIPDENLLEELMSRIDPSQELVETPPLELDEMSGESILAGVINKKVFFTVILSLFALFVAIKLWLLFGWKWVSHKKKKIRMAYTAAAALLADLGIYRKHGETRMEFADRLKDSLGINTMSITQLNELNIYGNKLVTAGNTDLSAAVKECKASYDVSHSKIKRYLAFFSPLSLGRIWKW